MAYGNTGNTGTGSSSYNKSSYNSNKPQATAAQAAPISGGDNKKKSDAILTRLLRPSKSGKSVATFAVGDQDLVIPAGTRVVITALSDKRMAALEKTSKERGFKGATPTHELVVFPIDQSKFSK